MGTTTASPPRSLADELRDRSDPELAALLRARPDLVTPPPADITQLASRATTRASVTRAVDRLDRFTLEVLETVVALPEPTTPAAVRSALGTTAAATRSALGALREQALVWGPAQEVRAVRAVHDVIGPHPAGLGPPLAVALGRLPAARVQTLAADLGVPADGAQELAAATIALLPSLLGELGDEAGAALQTLAAGPPSGRVDRADRDVDRATARTPIDQLLARGLVVPHDASTVVLPREVGLLVRGGVIYPSVQPHAPIPAVIGSRDPEIIDRTAGSGAFELIRRIETLLEHWGHEPPAVLRSGGLGVRDLRRLPPLLDTDEAGAALIAELAYVSGLVSFGTDGEVWMPTAAYDMWLRDGPANRWSTVASSWLATSRVAGLIGGRDDRDRIIAPLGPGIDRSAAPEIRRVVLNVLAELPRGAVPEPTEVLDAVRWRRPRRGGRLRDSIVRWTLAELETIGLTGHGALATHATPLLDGRPAEAALKAASAALAAVLPEPLDHVLVQADLTAVAPGPLRADLARELTAMSEVESRGGASVHRFTPESIRSALDGGRSASDLHEFVGRISRTPVPQPLTYLIDDVARRHGALRAGPAASFVRCDDSAVIAEIVATPRALALGVRRIAPTVLISSLDPATLIDRLRDLGYSPTAESADGTLMIARMEPSRAPGGGAPEPLTPEPPAPSTSMLAAAVRALRSGDRSAAGRPTGASAGRPGRSAPVEMLAGLRQALDEGRSVWIGYVDHHGTTTERVVDPVRIEGGWLTAFDHRSGEVKTFAVHRISGMAPLDQH